MTATGPDESRSTPVGHVFGVFLGLGLTSFGGPVAHLGYFREALVERRRWLSAAEFADLVSLCQFLPGPASSQLGMAIGLRRAGLKGLVAAWCGFTLPSAIIMTALGFSVGFIVPAATPWVSGLMAAAVAVVAHAVLAMAPLAGGLRRATIAVASTIAVLAIPTPFTQLAVIAAAGLVGAWWLPAPPAPKEPSSTASVGRRTAVACLVAFVALLAVLPWVASMAGSGWQMLAGVYRAGALVFGGGHVVLPLLDSQTVGAGLVDPGTFVAGYASAQALPGPLFAFAAFLGFVSSGAPNGVIGAGFALVAIFLPGALLVVGVQPFWDDLRRSPRAARALQGVNAAVVGILAAALYSPVITTGIRSVPALLIAVAGFIALRLWRAPAWLVVVGAALGGAVFLA